MRTRYGTPLWGQDVAASRVPTFPRFRGDHTADVVIIGGGLTGSVWARRFVARESCLRSQVRYSGRSPPNMAYVRRA